jgi:hypothetical protein
MKNITYYLKKYKARIFPLVCQRIKYYLVYPEYYFRFYPTRKGTTDFSVYYQVFIKKEYDIDYEKVPKLIIDGGANVGYASVFFCKKISRS